MLRLNHAVQSVRPNFMELAEKFGELKRAKHSCQSDFDIQ